MTIVYDDPKMSVNESLNENAMEEIIIDVKL